MNKVWVELTEFEAHALCYVCAKIMGETSGPRGSLDKAGVKLANAVGNSYDTEYDFYEASKTFIERHGYEMKDSIRVNSIPSKLWEV